MARFHFQLDGVLRHRERLEKDRQHDLAIAQTEMAHLQSELAALDAEVKRNTSDVRDHHLLGNLKISFLAAHRRYMLVMQRKIIAQAQKMAQQQAMVDRARLALVEASKQKKILEKLRERQQAAWAEKAHRRENSELDELATQMSYRQIEQTGEAS